MFRDAEPLVMLALPASLSTSKHTCLSRPLKPDGRRLPLIFSSRRLLVCRPWPCVRFERLELLNSLDLPSRTDSRTFSHTSLGEIGWTRVTGYTRVIGCVIHRQLIYVFIFPMT